MMLKSAQTLAFVAALLGPAILGAPVFGAEGLKVKVPDTPTVMVPRYHGAANGRCKADE
jgi:hypothetical protein